MGEGGCQQGDSARALGHLMDITLQFFDGCPNWQVTERRLSTLVAEGLDVTIGYQRIESYESAIEHRFRGSPTVLINGVDPFADGDAPVGVACRIYETESGPAGSPTLDQLRAAIAAGNAT
jgi:hypothetical protein